MAFVTLVTACGGGSSGTGVSAPSTVSVAESGTAVGTATSTGAGISVAPASFSLQAASKPASATTTSDGPIVALTRTADMPQDASPVRRRTPGVSGSLAYVNLDGLNAEKRGVVARKTRVVANESAAIPTQVGLGRNIDATATEAATAQVLVWNDSPGKGRIAAIHFATPDAKGVRLGVRITSLPLGTMLRFYVAGGKTMIEVSAQQLLASIQRSLDAGETGEAAHTYWSPDLGGEEITLEIEVPPGTDTALVQMAIPRLTHMFVQADALSATGALGNAAACTLDVSCTHAYDTESKSVARMTFVKDGDGYACTGTLLNDKASSGTPYFLSAYHCISTQAEASSLVTDWFFHSSQCGNGVLSDATRTVYGGATLLLANANADTDTSFMSLAGTPPPGAVYAAWIATPPPIGNDAFGLHHPLADLQKYSTGKVIDYFSCIAHTTDGNCTFATATPSTARFIEVMLGQGPVQPGSSGSPLFTTSNGTSVLVGQLFGGAASCTNAIAVYGRFDVAYNAGMSQWLNAPAHPRIPIYRFYNTDTSTHFYTASATERDTVRNTTPKYSYEGIAFYAYSDGSTGATALERFYNSKTGAHFYTISADEAQNVKANSPAFAYEGKSWFADTNPTTGATAMYRFFNTRTGTHFYTISAAERDSVLQSSPNYNYEGVGYYAWTAL
ncbi:lysyl endopeptidase [Variovorax sp. GrIS 2.14]|uniref:serine protease n=1 Tax=Variovorax sp. GrIS 2.14 TaxID=3071709 RepID=UPI0038F7624C